MAAVSYSLGTKINNSLTNESPVCVWISPATMDSADTVVLPTITGRTPVVLSCLDQSDGSAATATISSQTVTIDAAGGTTDHTYVLTYTYL
jgi:hypothetical protein